MYSLDKKSKRGLTLIEIILTLAILGIVIATAYSLNIYGVKSFAASNRNAKDQFEVRMPADFIAKKIRYADKVKILNSINTSPETGSHQIYIENGKLIYKEYNNPIKIIGTSNEGDYAFTIERSSRGANIISYTLGKEGTTNFNLKTEVVALNLKGSITGDSKGIYIEFFTKQADDIIPVSIVDLVEPDLVQAVQGEKISSPHRITAKMSDGTTRNVAVKWSPKQIDTTTSGYKSITGTVVGTSKTVNYNVLVGDYIVQDIPNITIEKNKNEAFIMPLKVQGTLRPMSGTEELLGEVEVLSWERNLDTLNPGTYTAQGISQRYLDEFGSYKQFTLTLIVSDTPTATIQSISTLFQSVLRGGTYNLPSHVVAYMSDGSQQSVPVSWNTNVVDTSVVGTRTITGTVSGYSNPVILELNIVNQKLIIENVIVQEGKSNGTLIVYGNAGATVVLKDGTGNIMKYGIVIPESGKVIITGVDTRSNKHGVDTVMLMMNNWGNSDVWKLNY